MNSHREAARIFGFQVTDSSGNRIGHVDNVWIDDTTNELEFVGVKTGRIMGKTHVIPVGRSRISDHTIQLPFTAEQIKNAPSFSGDEELTPEQEEEIYSYYGDERSTNDGSSGLPDEQ